jgi:hypothetical protein
MPRWVVGWVALVLIALTPFSSRAACPPNYGDLNASGAVNIADVQCSILVTLWELSGDPVPPPTCAAPPVVAWDINCDANLSLPDIQVLIAIVLGQPLPAVIDSDGDGCPNTCQAQTPCLLATPVSCGEVVEGTTSGGANVWAAYACETWSETGPERIYALNLDSADTIALALTTQGADLDVFVLGPSCEPSQCLGSGDTDALAAVSAGTTFLVVDGFQGGSGAFSLSVQCASQCDAQQICQDVECGLFPCAGVDIDCGGCPGGESCSNGECIDLGSCAGACGESSPGGCFCDALCVSFGDCCGDFCVHCAQQYPQACSDDCGNGQCEASKGENCSNCLDCGCAPGLFCQGTQCKQGQGSCCDAHPGAGCEDFVCTDCVCALEPLCCAVSWDATCVGTALDACEGSCPCAP